MVENLMKTYSSEKTAYFVVNPWMEVFIYFSNSVFEFSKHLQINFRIISIKNSTLCEDIIYQFAVSRILIKALIVSDLIQAYLDATKIKNGAETGPIE